MPVDYKGSVNQLLSGVSVQFSQDQSLYIADEVFPTYPVEHKSDDFMVFPRGWFLRDQVQERPLGDEPAEATYGLTQQTYRAKEYALAASLDDRERANARPPHDPEKSHVEFLTEQHLIHRERLFSTNYFTAGKWGRDLTGITTEPVTGSQTNATQIMQWDQADSKPQRAVNELQETMGLITGREGNLLLIGRSVYTMLLDHPEIIERRKYTTSEAINKEVLATYFGVEKVLVPAATHNIAPELAPQLGDNVTLQHIFNRKGMLLLYRNNRVGLKMVTAGVNFVWRGLLGAAGFSFPVYTDRKKRAFSDWFAVRSAYDMRIVAPDCGIYVDSIIA